MDDEKFRQMFEKYGPISSLKVMYKEDGRSKGFGFVAFENAESADKAVLDLNGTELADGKKLYVGRAQKKMERHQELTKKFEHLRLERLNKYQGVNLYVKNLDDTIDSKLLENAFSAFGTITSAKVNKVSSVSFNYKFPAFFFSDGKIFYKQKIANIIFFPQKHILII